MNIENINTMYTIDKLNNIYYTLLYIHNNKQLYTYILYVPHTHGIRNLLAEDRR